MRHTPAPHVMHERAIPLTGALTVHQHSICRLPRLLVVPRQLSRQHGMKLEGPHHRAAGHIRDVLDLAAHHTQLQRHKGCVQEKETGVCVCV